MAERYTLKIITDFASAHTLRDYPGACARMHGHNWKIEVYVIGENLDKAGVLVDFGVIKKHVAEIMAMLDHKYLNELPAFENKQPSSENIAYFIATELQQRIDNSAVSVSRVTAWESDDAGATYIV